MDPPRQFCFLGFSVLYSTRDPWTRAFRAAWLLSAVEITCTEVKNEKVASDVPDRTREVDSRDTQSTADTVRRLVVYFRLHLLEECLSTPYCLGRCLRQTLALRRGANAAPASRGFLEWAKHSRRILVGPMFTWHPLTPWCSPSLLCRASAARAERGCGEAALQGARCGPPAPPRQPSLFFGLRPGGGVAILTMYFD